MSVLPRLFALGSNGSGQLGVGYQNDVSKPEQCVFTDHEGVAETSTTSDKVIKIVAGGTHTLVLTLSGTVYAAGSNEAGKCGLPVSVSESSAFQRVTPRAPTPGKEDVPKNSDEMGLDGKRIKDVAATWEASIFITAEDEIFVCGRGTKGELGLGAGVTEAPKATRIPYAGFGVRAISASMSHVVLLSQEGDLYGWGSSRKGQLGQEKVGGRFVWSPSQVHGVPFPGVSVATGRLFTVVVGSALGQLRVFGNDKYLPAAGKTSDLLAAAGELRPCHVLASWSSIYFLRNGRLAGQGRNDRGQLPPDSLPELRSFAAGSEHCVALSMGGDVVAWGWGEHGNCGTVIDARGNPVGQWSSIPLKLARNNFVYGVGAGCATTFVMTAQATAAAYPLGTSASAERALSGAAGIPHMCLVKEASDLREPLSRGNFLSCCFCKV